MAKKNRHPDPKKVRAAAQRHVNKRREKRNTTSKPFKVPKSKWSRW